MILLVIGKNKATTWREVEEVEVTEQSLTCLTSMTFFIHQYTDIRYAELILPNGGKAVLYRDETGGE